MKTPTSTSELLRDLLLVTKDGDWGKDEPKDGFVPYRVIRGGDFPDARVGDVSSVPRCYLDAKTVQRRTLQADDILIETAGGNWDRPTGRTFLITQRLLDSLGLPATCASFCRYMRVDPGKADPTYVFWYLQYLYSRGEMWEHQVQHTGVARFQYTRFAETTLIPLPARSVQCRVADILGGLDDKIKLNRRINETLEAMTRALFKSWFVDFDPVRTKAAVRRQHPNWSNAQISRAAIPNLDPAIAELFPDRFEDSAIGRIPAGWNVTKLADHVEASKGLSYKGSGLSDVGVPMHNLNSVYEGGGYKFEGIKFYTGEYRERHIVNAGDVIVANTEQGHDCLLIGYAAVVPAVFGAQGLYTHHIYRLQIRTGSPVTPDFLCRLLNSRRMHEFVSGFGNGTTVNMLPLDGVQQPGFALAPAPIINAFTPLAVDTRRRQEAFISQNRDLACTRDSLLPRLLSGELSVADGDRRLEAAHE